MATNPDPNRLAQFAIHADYVGSSEHKSAPFGSLVLSSGRRKDASVCPTSLNQRTATAMLRAAILVGNVSEDEDAGMPRRVWYDGKLGIFEARLTDRADIDSNKPASYKAWPEDRDRIPKEVRTVGDVDAV